MSPEITVFLIIEAVVFGFVLAVLWTLLPFAVFGIKKRLDRLVALQIKQLEEMRK